MDIQFDDIENTISFDETPELAVTEDVQPEETPELDSEVVKTSEEPKKEQHPMHAEYLTIFDAIMFEDMYEETVRIGKKYNAVLRSRSADSDMQITRQLDSMKFNTVAAYQSMSAILTLSHSLQEFCGKDLRDMKVADRYLYVRTRPSQVVEILSQYMADFDVKIKNALAYGEVNF